VKISPPVVNDSLLAIAARWLIMTGNQALLLMPDGAWLVMRGAYVMIAKLHLHHNPPYRRKKPPLRMWQRLTVGSVLFMAVAISAALIYFQPGTRTLIDRDMARPAPMAETAPALPPGTDSYYYWGQWKPLDQQP
jgi:hypothetical protein